MATIASLIIDVAANTANLQRDVQQIGTQMDSITSTAGKLAGALGATFSIAAVVAFAREIATFASDMEDASAKTGIGVEQLQALTYAASGAGVSVDQIASAVAQLSKRLVGGGDSAVSALESLGLRVSDILQMDPAEAFLIISERIAGIDNPMRQAAIAMELFGKSGADLLPAMKEDLRGLMEQAIKTRAVMGEDLVGAADRFDDSLGHAAITAKAWTVQAVDLIARGWEQSKVVQVLAGSWDALSVSIAGADGGMEQIVNRLERQADGTRAFVREVDDLKMSTFALEKAQKELDAQERKNVKTREDHARATKMAEEAQRDYINWIGEREIEAIKANQEAHDEWSKKAIEGDFAASAAAIEWAQESAQARADDVASSEEWYRAVHDDMARHEHDMIAHVTTLREQWEMLGDNLVERTLSFMGIISEQLGPRFSRAVDGMVGAWSNGQRLMKGIGQLMAGDFSGLIGTIQAGIALVKSAWGGLKGLFSQEVEHANDTRDNFVEGLFGGGHNLAALLTSLGAGDGGGDLYAALIGAKDVAGVNAAKAAIEQFLHDKGQPGFALGSAGGTGGFEYFGAGTSARLHNWERVQTPAQAAQSDGTARELKALSMAVMAAVNDLPNQIQAALAVGRGRGMSRA